MGARKQEPGISKSSLLRFAPCRRPDFFICSMAAPYREYKRDKPQGISKQAWKRHKSKLRALEREDVQQIVKMNVGMTALERQNEELRKALQQRDVDDRRAVQVCSRTPHTAPRCMCPRPALTFSIVRVCVHVRRRAHSIARTRTTRCAGSTRRTPKR